MGRTAATMSRKYEMKCPVARALDVIGDRWTVLILRDLFLHPARRFQDFEASLPGLTPSVLSARLKALEAEGVIAGRLYEEHPPRFEYFLTAKGRELGPVLMALKKWGEKHG
jgi:DNA-binding HxlR family transcriptional regulator